MINAGDAPRHYSILPILSYVLRYSDYHDENKHQDETLDIGVNSPLEKQ